VRRRLIPRDGMNAFRAPARFHTPLGEEEGRMTPVVYRPSRVNVYSFVYVMSGSSKVVDSQSEIGK
jgi:hypothetical protein